MEMFLSEVVRVRVRAAFGRMQEVERLQGQTSGMICQDAIYYCVGYLE